MGKGEWITLLGVVAALITAGLAGWVNNEGRISLMESKVEILETARITMVGEILEITKALHELRGMHQDHEPAIHPEKD